ncbi:TPA: hypothetical protein ACQVJ5_003671 [Serratia marcescens]|uniref:hypothetical protein n=1 Tax=Serratia TaxID=613 RepID=UPI0009305F41|nr:MULTISPECIES: hypothetical protein [Serratia]HEJ7039461.1 hypothetical protein [Serratia liquefaciens]MBH2683712.1 hypothetical protein [Serratia marcescens]MBP1129200.1 hypothetical protein [Serratia sp. PL17]MDK5932228.1 hypothetical protein [Serratia nevei]MEC5551295.1 hypothetical protein [Serratia nevei]
MAQQPTEYALRFRIWYSYWLEVMTETINRRIDLTANAVMLILGAGIFANSGLSQLFGAIVAIISGIRVAFQHGKKSEAARQQAKRYLSLINEMHNLSVDEMNARVNMLEEFDSNALSSLFNPARNRAMISLGKKKHHEKLSIVERLVSALAGGVPR